MGGMAFPSASEPNPVAQGLRGPGPETINMPTPPAAPAPAPSPSTPTAPPPPANYTGQELFQLPGFTVQGGPYSGDQEYAILQGGQGSTFFANPNTPGFLLNFGYTNSGQVPTLPGNYVGGQIFDNPGQFSAAGTYTGSQLQQYAGSPTGTVSFGYNTQNPAFTQYAPTYNPINLFAANSGSTGYTGSNFTGGYGYLNPNAVPNIGISGNNVTSLSGSNAGQNLGTLSAYQSTGS